MSADLEQLKKLYDLMLEKDLDSLEIKDAESRIQLTRRKPAGQAVSYAVMPQAVQAPHASAPKTPVVPSQPAARVPTIDSPLAGVFYRASSPTSAPFSKEGDVVEAGQSLCIVEAMKVMNEIKAEKRCKILKIVAENGRSVSAGQPLFHIEPA